ncbi:glutamate-1-semialdehyde-2,1-aminomutase [bacterium]|nr:MAG: glutamate-1-semialdehyde-2,1-aminomutase [bacterium]
MDQNRSKELLARAAKVIPGGVNSPVRAFGAAHVAPPFIASAVGPYMDDVDGNRYVDYIGSWGPMLLGQAYPPVIEAVREAATRGTSFGAPTLVEIELAEQLVARVPSLEMVRMVNSGTEATMSAVRVARGVTGRDKFIKFVGCYHGHGDAFLIEAGSGLATFGEPSSPGVPAATAQDTLTAPYNDLDAVRELFKLNPGQIAAIIVEPVAGNMGCILPREGYLEGLREICTAEGALLIFDEVMTGFRVGPQCAQGRFGITPDLTTLGKVIGGGLPVGAYGGRKDLMEQVSPAGPIYQAGTLSGNPLAMAAGLAMLEGLFADPVVFERIERTALQIGEGLAAAAARHGIDVTVQQIGSMGCMYFIDRAVSNFEDAAAADADRFYRFHASMLERGIYLAPSPFEAFFVGAAHGPAEVEKTLAAADATFAGL